MASYLSLAEKYVDAKEFLKQKLVELGASDADADDVINSMRNTDYIVDTANLMGLFGGAYAQHSLGGYKGFLATYLINSLANFGGKAVSLFNKKEILSKIKTDEQDYNEKARHSKTLLVEQPNFKVQDTGEKFPGFKGQGHVLLIGSTNSGKTSWLVTSLYDDIFNEFDMFVFVGAKAAQDDMINLYNAVAYHFKIDKQESYENKFVYFHNDKIEDAILFCEHKEPEKRKLVFFDDMQAGGRKIKEKIANFILQAKHSKCTLITTMHNPTDADFAKQIRENSRYFVMFNLPDNQFNFLLHLPIGNATYKKYSMIEGGRFQRVLIYDREGKLYYGTGQYLEFDPLYKLKNEDKEASDQEVKITLPEAKP